MKLTTKLAVLASLVLCCTTASAGDVWYDVVQLKMQFLSIWYDVAQ